MLQACPFLRTWALGDICPFSSTASLHKTCRRFLPLQTCNPGAVGRKAGNQLETQDTGTLCQDGLT